MFSLAVVSGCSRGDAATTSPGAAKASDSVVIAIDTSGSAQRERDGFFASAKQLILEMPLETRLTLYRFDARPAEVYSGPPPNGAKATADKLREVRNYVGPNEGTNLAKLFTLVDKQLSREAGALKLVVFTDCGIEKMTEAERRSVTEMVTRWNDQGRLARLELVGVAAGHREALRDMLPLPGQVLQIKDLGA